ncbi:hypothetical protein HK405_010841, partial [Cladochytrium tenue]
SSATSVRVQFATPDAAVSATEALWARTNIYAHFHDAGERQRAAAAAAQFAISGADGDSTTVPQKTGAGASPRAELQLRGGAAAPSEPAATVHVQNLDRGVAALEELCHSTLPDVARIGFHQECAFLCFDAIPSAEKAVAVINRTTKMRVRVSLE